MPEEFIGLAAVVLIFAIPIVAILVKHQQKMAELVRLENPRNNDALLGEIHRLRTEVASLKELVHSNVLDQEMRATPPALQERLESKSDA
ncbi:MAG: hypothetical protein AB7F50_11775 [Fimbriimonadaceae bacterium]